MVRSYGVPIFRINTVSCSGMFFVCIWGLDTYKLQRARSSLQSAKEIINGQCKQ